MNKIDQEILKIDKVICDNIEKSEYLGRKLLSQNILSQLRNFVEHISLKVYSDGKDIEATFENIQKANKYVKSKGNLRFLSKFHKLLQISVSHYTPDEENSERLMLKYYEYLIKIKLFLKKKYNIEVLHNIEKFPINNDSDLKEYYKRILERLNQSTDTGSVIQDRYYIQKVKPIFFDENIFYEVTLSLANDNTSKFDRIIAFTKLELTHNYAVKLNIKKDVINILGKEMPILIIIDWEVSIRPCELENFSKIFGISLKIQSGYKEYRELMQFLTKTGLNLVEIIDLSEKEYLEFKDKI